MEIALFLLWAILVGSLALASLSLAPWMPTRNKDLEQVDHIINLKPKQIFLEFGCGTARVSSYIAKKNPDCEIIGIEYSIPLFVYSRIKWKLVWPKNMTVQFGNAFKYPLHTIDVIYTFGMPKTINKPLKKKLLKEMKSWAKFVSYVFKIEDREWWATIHHEWTKNYSWVYVFTKS